MAQLQIQIKWLNFVRNIKNEIEFLVLESELAVQQVNV